MREIRISHKLKSKLSKLYKKDKSLYNTIVKKMEEISNSKDINHYKNLKKPLNMLKRVHVKSYVLLFSFDSRKDVLTFYDFAHHDEVYKV